MMTVQALREQIMNLETELDSVKKLAQHAGEVRSTVNPLHSTPLHVQQFMNTSF
jgi:hypothetical protein